MSYFSPRIYNIQNLNKDDRSEVAFWRQLIRDAAEEARSDPEDGGLIDRMRAEIRNQALDDFLEEADRQIACLIVSRIDGYGDSIDIPERAEICSMGGLGEWDEAQCECQDGGE